MKSFSIRNNTPLLSADTLYKMQKNGYKNDCANSILEITSVINDRIDRIPEVDTESLKKLALRLRKLIYAPNNESRENDINQIILDMVYEYIGRKADSSVFGAWMGSKTTNSNSSLTNKAMHGHSDSAAYKNFTITFANAVKNFRKKINNINKNEKLGRNEKKSQIQALITEGDEVMRIGLECIEFVKKRLADNKNLGIHDEDGILNNALDKINKAIELKDNIDIFSEVEKCYDALVGISIAQHMSGNFGEALEAACDDKIWSLVEKELNEHMKKNNSEIFKLSGGTKGKIFNIIEQNIVGDESSEILLRKDEIDLRHEKLFNSSQKDGMGNYYTFGTTQNKIDVQVMVNGSSQNKSSVKAYSLGKYSYKDKSGNIKTGENWSITAQKDFSLFPTLVFLERYSRFGSYWALSHTRYEKDDSFYDYLRIPEAIAATQEYQKTLDVLLKKEIAYEALSIGNPLKEGIQPANNLVIIDLNSAEIFYLNIKEILQNLTTNMNVVSITNPVFEKIIFKYNNTETAKEGKNVITLSARDNLIQQIHKTNLHIQVNTKLVKEHMKNAVISA